jgi:hypothetical protein
MDQDVADTEPDRTEPDRTEPDQRAPRAPGPRLGLGLLLIAVAAATVAVPALVAPRHKSAPATPATIPPMAQLYPAGKSPASSPASAHRSTVPQPCTAPTAPACAIYTTGLGRGWSVSSDGLKVLPGATAPAAQDPALLVERSDPATAHTTFSLAAAGPITIKSSDRLSFRVWGGRDFGTVLKLAATPDGFVPSAGTTTVSAGALTLTAPAGKWSTFSIYLGDLSRGTSLTGIRLTVATDVVSTVNPFYLDDIALVS